jgi:hypothetical protein
MGLTDGHNDRTVSQVCHTFPSRISRSHRECCNLCNKGISNLKFTAITHGWQQHFNMEIMVLRDEKCDSHSDGPHVLLQ